MEKISVYFSPNETQAEIIKKTFSENNIKCKVKADEQNGFEILVEKDDEQAAKECLEAIGVIRNSEKFEDEKRDSIPVQFVKTAVFAVIVLTVFTAYVVGVDKIIEFVKNHLF